MLILTGVFPAKSPSDWTKIEGVLISTSFALISTSFNFAVKSSSLYSTFFISLSDSTFKTCDQVLVMNGTLGLSSHHGIHGNQIYSFVLDCRI